MGKQYFPDPALVAPSVFVFLLYFVFLDDHDNSINCILLLHSKYGFRLCLQATSNSTSSPNKINKIHVNISSDEFECSNIKPICIPSFTKDLISFDKKFGYLFVYGDKDKIYKYQQRWTDKTHFLID